MHRPSLAGLLLLGLAACETMDVEQPPEETELYQLADAAFGEYLSFLEIPGISSDEVDGETTWFIDISLVDGVQELALSKTSTNIESLKESDVVTAADKITDLDGIQFFTNLEILRLTANDLEALDVTALPNLARLEMNFNKVGQLDLTQNPRLFRFRYQGSSQAEDGQRISEIDLSGNPELRHLYLPAHEIVTIDLSNNVLIDDVLDLSGNPGPDGNPDTPDIIVPAEIYDQVPEETRLGVISDADAGVAVFLASDVANIDEVGGSATLTASLNLMADVPVVIDLGLGGSATVDVDYSISEVQLTIPVGELSATTTLTGIDDDDSEGIETIEIDITMADGAATDGAETVTVSVDDDDLPPPLLLNEILYDPSNSGLAGDANGDGSYVQDEDEFIEIINISGGELDISGFRVWDTEAWNAGTYRHEFPPGTTLAADEVFLLFGGGIPTGFSGVQVAICDPDPTNMFDDVGMNLNNSGDLLRITDPTGVIVLEFDVEPLSNNPNESYTRSPDLTGAFDQHGNVVTDVLFSPGTRTDGSPF